MTFLSRFRGSPEARFAAEVLAAIRAKGVDSAWIDEEHFAVAFQRTAGDEPARLFLHNIFDEYSREDRADRRGYVARVVETISGVTEMPDRSEEVRSQLRPVLRLATYDLGRQRDDQPLVSRPFLPHLREFVVVDQPDSMTYVTRGRLEDWAVSEAEVFDQARENLSGERELPRPAADGPAVVAFEDDGDGYVVSRLLEDGWLASKRDWVGGRPVAFIPDHNTLILMADDPEHVAEQTAAIVRDFDSIARAISPVPYTVDGTGAVIPYPASAEHPAATAVANATVVLAAAAYAPQTEFLTKQFAQAGNHTAVADLMYYWRPDGSALSVASWTEGPRTLLPSADYLALQGTGVTGLLVVPWGNAIQHLALTPVDGLVPPRFDPGPWPTTETMQRLRAHAVPPSSAQTSS